MESENNSLNLDVISETPVEHEIVYTTNKEMSNVFKGLLVIIGVDTRFCPALLS